jgi:phospholipid/cholesterol/gamma-HCH transport system substrate-binding protein
LRELANAGDDLATASQLIFTYPFTDAIAGGSPARASSPCTAYDPAVPATQNNALLRKQVAEGACYGDFMNLDINLSLNTGQLTNLVEGLLSLGNTLGSPRSTGSSSPASSGSGAGAAGAPANQLVELVEGLTSQGDTGLPSLPGTSGGTGSQPSPSASPSASASTSSRGGSSSGGGGGICSLLGNCRVTTTSELMATQTEDVARLVLGPVVQR